MSDYETKTARAAINEAYNGHPNIMTPYAVDFGMIGPRLSWELSQGDGIFPGTLVVGVTFASKHGGKWTREHELSQAFSGERTADRLDVLQSDSPAIREARAYIASVARDMASPGHSVKV